MRRTVTIGLLMSLSFVGGYGLARLRGRPYQAPKPDPFRLEKYKTANTTVRNPPVVVFFGDSIIELWDLEKFFPGKGYVNRGIGGQTTTEMLGRFYQDVIDLKPSAVVICGGTNDKTRGFPDEQITVNTETMCRVALAHQIKPIVARMTSKTTDGIHPSDAGYAEMSEFIRGALPP